MAKPDDEADRTEAGGEESQSAEPVSKTESGDQEVDDEEWGYSPRKAGLATETKAGLGIIVLLLATFALLVYTKFDRLEDMKQAAMEHGSNGLDRLREATGQKKTPLPERSFEEDDESVDFVEESVASYAPTQAAGFDDHVAHVSSLQHEPDVGRSDIVRAAAPQSEDIPFDDVLFDSPSTPQELPNEEQYRVSTRLEDDFEPNVFAREEHPVDEPREIPEFDIVANDDADRSTPAAARDEPAFSDDEFMPLDEAVARSAAPASTFDESLSDPLSDDPLSDLLDEPVDQSTTPSNNDDMAFDFFDEPVAQQQSPPADETPAETATSSEIQAYDPFAEPQNAPADQFERTVAVPDAQPVASNDELLMPNDFEASLGDLFEDEPRQATATVAETEEFTPLETPSTEIPLMEEAEPRATFDFHASPSTSDDGFGEDLFADSPAEPSEPAVAAEQAPFDPFAGQATSQSRQFVETTPEPAAPPAQRYPAPIEADSTRREFTREIPLAKSPAEPLIQSRSELYTIRRSDSYWSISQRQYGTARYFQALARFNARRVKDPRRMKPGVQIETPPPAVLEQTYPNLFPELKTAQTKPKSGNDGYFVSQRGEPMYRARSTDTLSGIAHRHLGKASRWKEIYGLNRSRLKNPNTLKPGTVLALPRDASRVSLIR